VAGDRQDKTDLFHVGNKGDRLRAFSQSLIRFAAADVFCVPALLEAVPGETAVRPPATCFVQRFTRPSFWGIIQP
jgi:hypothetical protein